MLVRVTPDVRGETHEKISTGQANSKFGFGMAEAGEAIARLQAVAGLSLRGVHAHIGSQLLGLEPFRREVAELAKLGGTSPCGTWAAGSACSTPENQQRAAVDRGVRRRAGAGRRSAHGMGPDTRGC